MHTLQAKSHTISDFLNNILEVQQLRDVIELIPIKFTMYMKCSAEALPSANIIDVFWPSKVCMHKIVTGLQIPFL
jgi:hypothetical protein